MRVNPNSQSSAVTGTPPAVAARQPRLEQDKLAISIDPLDRALQQTPEARAEKVAEARAQLQNGCYPPATIIHKISALLAINIDSHDSSN